MLRKERLAAEQKLEETEAEYMRINKVQQDVGFHLGSTHSLVICMTI